MEIKGVPWIVELIHKYRYYAETHNVTTKDGYILELHRISGGDRYPPKPGKRVVLLTHGLLGSSADWVILGPGLALGYLLSDQNYDVWLSNARGNRYSRSHISLNPENRDFWLFSFHEIGIYDLPSTIDYILDVTGQSSLFYCGHSQGSTTFWVLLSERPEYNSKIIMMQSFAPVAFMANPRSPIVQAFAQNLPAVEMMFATFGIYEFMPSSDWLRTSTQLLCSETSPVAYICKNSLFLVVGFDPKQMNSTILPQYLGHMPAGSSARQGFHYCQLAISDGFQQYDFGAIENFRRYHQLNPPDYKLYRAHVPTVIHYAANDWIVNVTDVDKLTSMLPNVHLKHLINFENFNHFDYVIAADVKRLLYDMVIDLFNKF
ncbi:lipase 3-like [Lutzomyia longipalpis]|uniref:lipase 3-like n=1 Tax=Lutzomyia longipalpis TaxID=7200 RepID=UPI002483BB26|nr:lipase 3-like [Lutzomyia longipalpis]